MRLFFAIDVADELRVELARLQGELRNRVGEAGLRLTHPAGLHVTLQFLGEVPAELLTEVRAAGAEAAARCGSFKLGDPHVEAFPSLQSPRIICVGFRRGLPEFALLAEYLLGAAKVRGVPTSTERGRGRKSIPHVTLARIKTEAAAAAAARALASNNFGKVDKGAAISVYNIDLLASELRPEGSQYTVLDTFALAAS